MMDFKLILLLVGLGLLLMVILYALWGFFGGLKRELKCTAVLLILLLFGWLIFSDPAVMMSIALPASLTSMLSSLGVAEGSATVWEVVLQVLRTQVPNGEALFIEGREAYELAYNLVAGVFRGLGLMVITLVMIFVSSLVRLVSHIVKLIVNKVKKNKAKQAAETAEVVEEQVEEKPQPENEQVLVLKGVEGTDDVTVTTSENDLPAPKKIKDRIWGAVVGAVKACIIICIVFVPVSGVVAVASEISPETRELASKAIAGELEMTAEEKDAVDLVFDFVEAYKKSAVGTVVESSSYFFGDSFSSLMFDGAFYVTTDSQKIYLREELVTFIDAINALEGNVDYKNLEQAKLEAALDALKDSKLLPEAMPVAIEYAYEMEAVNKALINANQEALFLQLRYIDWNKDLEKVLDVVKVAYKLDLFAEDFNALTLDVNKVREIVGILNQTEFLSKALPVGLQTALKVEAVQKLVKDSSFKPLLNDVDWAHDLNSLVDVYESFQKFGITKLEGIDKEYILSKVFEENNTDVVKEILTTLTGMDIFTSVVTPAAQRVVDGILTTTEQGSYSGLKGVLSIEKLTAEEWKADINGLVDLAEKLYDINVFTFDIKQISLSSDKSIEAIKETIDLIFGTQTEDGLNFLNKNNTLSKATAWALTKFDVVASDVNVNAKLSDVVWANEGEVLKQLVDIYKKLEAYDEVELAESKFDYMGLLEEDGIGELITEALEALVESKVTMNLLNEIVDHKVTPIAEKYEADEVLHDILNNVTSEEIAGEIKLIVKAVFDAKALGFLEVPAKGVQALDLTKTEEMKSLVNALCDSKLIDGYEARILRVVLKVLKFDVEVEKLDVNYDDEQALLISFIDAVTPVLQDPEFKLFGQDGKIIVDTDFLTRQDVTEQLVNAVQILFGDYEAETKGSQLATNLLLDVYTQVVKGKLPVEYSELFETLDIEGFTNEELAHDISAVVYVAKELVTAGVQKLINNEPVEFYRNITSKHVSKAIDVLAELNIAKEHGVDLLVWGINFGVSKYNEKADESKKIILEVSKEDFADVVWGDELKVVKAAVVELEEFVGINNLSNTDTIQQFIKDEGYLKESFLTKENLHEALDIVEELVKLQLLPVFAELVMNTAVQKANELGINVEYLNSLTKSHISADLQNLMPILEKVVDLGVGEFVATKDIQEINYDLLASIISDETNGTDLLSLNIIKYAPAQLFSELINFGVKKAVKQLDFTLDAAELSNINWNNDFAKLADIVKQVGVILNDANIKSVSQFKDIMNILKTNETQRDLINNENIWRVTEVLKTVSEMQLLETISPKLAAAAITEFLLPKDEKLDFLVGSFTGEELMADIASLSELAPLLVDVEVVKLYFGDELAGIPENSVADIVKKLLSLNIVNNSNVEIVKYAINKVSGLIPDSLGLNVEYADDAFEDFTDEMWAEDQTLVAKAIGKAVYVLFTKDVNNIDSAKAFFTKNGPFTKVGFYDEETLNQLSVVVKSLVSANTVDVLLPSVLEFAKEKVATIKLGNKELGLDLTYLYEAYVNGDLNNDMLAEDVATLVEMAVMALNTNALDLIKEAKTTELTLVDYAPIVAKLGELHVFTCSSPGTATALINCVSNLLGLGYKTDRSYFGTVTTQKWLEDSAKLGDLLVEAQKVLDEFDLETVQDIIDYVKAEGYKNVEALATPERVDLLVGFVQKVLEFNAGDLLVTDIVNFALPKLNELKALKDNNIDVSFLNDQVDQKELHDDIGLLGDIAKEAIAFGAVQIYNERKSLTSCELVVELSHVSEIVRLLGEIKLYNQARGEWYEVAGAVLSKYLKYEFNITAEAFGNVNFTEDNVKIREVIMGVDQLLKDNNHNTIKEIVKFFKENGNNYRQWATEENAVAALDIVEDVADVQLLTIFAERFLYYGIEYLSKYDIDASFFVGNVYTPAMISSDLKSIIYMGREAIEFGVFDLLWEQKLDKIDVSHIANIVKEIENIKLFTLERAEWIALASQQVAKALKTTTSVEAFNFGGIDWAKENATLVEIITNVGELLDFNHFESTEELVQFVKQAAYLSVQYLREENVLKIAEILENVAASAVVEQLLPDLLNYGVGKVKSDKVDLSFAKFNEMEGSYISSDINTIAYMIREAVAFGAVEIYTNLHWKEKYVLARDIDLSHVKNIIASIEDINIFTNYRVDWIATIAKVANMDVTRSELESVDFPADNAKLVEIVDRVENLLDVTHISNMKDMYHFVELEGYKSAQYITDANVNAVADLINAVSEIQLLVPVAGQVFDKVIGSVGNFSFLEGELTGAQLVADVASVASAIKDVVAFGTIDLYYYGTCDYIDLSYVRSALQKVLELNILNVKRAKLTSVVANLAGKSLEMNTTADLFDSFNWAYENTLILNVVDGVAQLLRDMNIESTAQIKAFVDEKWYEKAQFVNEITIGDVLDILDTISNIQVLTVLSDKAAAFGLSKVNDIDLSFLVDGIKDGTITSEDLVLDLKKVISIGRDYMDYGLYDMIYSNTYKDADTDKFVEIFNKFDTLKVLNTYRPEWSQTIINKAFNSLGISVESSDLDGITDAMWEDEISALSSSLVAVFNYMKAAGYADNYELSEIISDFKANKYKETKNIINLLVKDENGVVSHDAIKNLLKVVDEVANSDVAGVVLLKGLKIGTDKLNEKDIDLSQLPDQLTTAEVQADVHTLTDAANDMVDFGLVELVMDKGTIQYEKLNLLYSAIDKLFTMNLLNKDSDYVVSALLKDANAIQDDGLKLADKSASINAIIEELAYVLQNQKIESVQKIINLVTGKEKYEFVFDALFTQELNSVATVLRTIGSDSFFGQVVLSGTKAYATNLLDKYAGLSDIYNIYDVTTLSEDLLHVANAINKVASVGIYSIYKNLYPIPYSNKEIVKVVLEELFALNYLNGTGRVAQIVDAVSNISNTDLSAYRNMNLDFAGDAAKLYAMYEDLELVLTDAKFPYKYVNNFADSKLDVSFILNQNVVNHLYNAVQDLMSTTIFKETDGVLFVFAIPLLKTAAPEYYEALNIKGLSNAELQADLADLVTVFETVVESDLIDALKDHNSQIYRYSVEDDIIVVLTKLVELHMSQNNGLTKVGNLVLRDLVNGKTIAGKAVPADSFTLDNVDWAADKDALIQIVRDALDILVEEDLLTVNKLKAINKDQIINLVLNDNNLDSISAILNSAAAMTLLSDNLAPAYQIFGLPEIIKNKYDKYVSYKTATSAQLIEDIQMLADVVGMLKQLGVVDIYNGAAINYDQADLVEAILNKVADSNYVALHSNELFNLLHEKLPEGLNTYSATVNDMSFASDIKALADVYRALVPYLLGSEFPYKTKADYKALVDAKGFTPEQVKTLLNYSLENLATIANVVEKVSEVQLAAYLLVDAYKMAPQNSLVALVNPADNSVHQVKNDLKTLAEMILAYKDLNLKASFEKKDSAYVFTVNSQSEVVEDPAYVLIDKLFELNLLEGDYSELVMEVLKMANINTDGVDLTNIDYEVEKQVLKDLVAIAFDFKDQMGFTTIQSMIDAYNKMMNLTVKDNLLINKVATYWYTDIMSHDVPFSMIPQLLEAVSDSNLVDNLAVALYNKFVASMVPAEFGNLDSYTPDLISEDLASLANVAKQVNEAKLYERLTNTNKLPDTVIPAVQEIIREVTSLNLLALKKQEIVAIVDKALAPDLSSLVVSNVDMTETGEQLAMLVPQLYVIYDRTNQFTLTINMLGDTPLWTNVADVYDGLVNIELVKLVAVWAAKNLVTNGMFDSFSDAKIRSMLVDAGNVVDALIELGVFSNNGIDMNNYDAIEKIEDAFFANFNLDATSMAYYNFLKNRLHNYGVLPVDYSTMNTADEVNAIKNVITNVQSFMSAYSSSIQNKAWSSLITNDCQAKVDQIVTSIYASDLFAGLFAPLLGGTVRIFAQTNNHFGELTTLTEADAHSLVASIFEVAGYANTLGVLDNNIQYSDTDTMKQLVNFLVNNEFTENNVDYFAKMLVEYIGGDVNAIDLSAVNYRAEAAIICAFLDEAHNALALPGVNFSDLNTIKNKDFILAAADACLELPGSVLFDTYLRDIEVFALSKVDYDNELLTILKDRLSYVNEYTNAQVLGDWPVLMALVKNLANLDIFENSGSTIALDDPTNLKGAVENALSLEAFNGNKNKVVDMLLSFVDFISVTIDYTGIAWPTEKPLFVEFIGKVAELLADPSFDINTVDATVLKNAAIQAKIVALVGAAADSEIGAQILPDVYNNNFRTAFPADYVDLIDFSDPGFTRSMWADEFANLFVVYNDLEDMNFGDTTFDPTFEQILSVYDKLFGLNGQTGIYSVVNDRETWLRKLVTEDSIPSVGGFEIDFDKVLPDTATVWENETLAIRELIAELSTYQPLTTPVSSFDFESVYRTDDYEALANILTVMSHSLSMRELVIALINDTINNSASASSYFNIQSFKSSAFGAQVLTDGYAYDESFWTAEEFATLAKLVVTLNHITYDSHTDSYDSSLIDFESMSYGLTGNTNYNGTYVIDANTGLLQLLQLMNHSKVFSVEALGGSTGSVAQFLDSNNVVDKLSVIGEISGTEATKDAQIRDLIAAVAEIKDTVGFASTSFTNNMTHQELYALLSAINNSNVLQGIIAELVDDAIGNATVTGYFNLDTYLTTDYKNAVASNTYVASFWTNTELSVLSKLVATLNGIMYDSSTDSYDSSRIDFNSMTLGMTGSRTYTDAYVVNANTGLLQLLQLMDLSSIFDVSHLGGSTGSIASFLSDKNIVTNTNHVGTISGANGMNQDAIYDLVNAINTIKTVMGFDAGINLVNDELTYTQIYNLLADTNQSVVLQKVLLDFIQTAVNSSSGAGVNPSLGSLLSSDYKTAVTNDNYDLNLFNNTEFAYLAKTFATINHLICAGGIADPTQLDFETVNYGLSGNTAYNAEYVIDSDTGILQVLQLMVYSKFFDVTSIGGSTGQIATLLTDSHVIDNADCVGSMPLDVNGQLQEINNLLTALNELRTSIGFVSGASEQMSHLSESELNRLLSSFNNSNILRTVLKELIKDNIDAQSLALTGNASSASAVMQLTYSWLYNELYVNTTMDTVANWNNELTDIIPWIRSLGTLLP